MSDPCAIVPKWDALTGTGLNAVEAKGPNDVWAIGTYYGIDFSGYYPIVLHWDGRRWRRVTTSSDITAGSGSAVDITAAGDVWALYDDTDPGDQYEGSAYFLNEWNETTRQLEQRYLHPIETVRDLAALSSTDIWLVGPRWSSDGNTMLGPLVMRYDGRRSRFVKTPFTSLAATSLNALSMLAPDDIWAVGDHLIARYHC